MNMEILQLIGSYGFPIVACVGMAWYVYTQQSENRKDIKELQESHREEMEKITTALNNNTMAIHDLTILIDQLKEK